MKRHLFVFSGQSNMVGASVLPPKKKIVVNNSYEYKHNYRLGNGKSEFVPCGYPVGEFIYANPKKAFDQNMVDTNGKSTLTNHQKNAFFTSSMRNLDSKRNKTVRAFNEFCESTAKPSASLAPLFAMEWEKLGESLAYAHIAKGGCSIKHFFTKKMCQEYSARMDAYNEKNGTNYDPSPLSREDGMKGASTYFFKKCKDFLKDAKRRFKEDKIASRSFVWLQGESDAYMQPIEYEIKLQILWDELKKLGFERFLCIRVDYFGSKNISRVMQAQEDFVKNNSDAFMLTRSASYFNHPNLEADGWYAKKLSKEYEYCRDSFFGYNNHHINEKGFSVLAKRSAKNAYRIICENKRPKLESELIIPLINKGE